jgi:proline-rich protein PRCC
MSLVAYDDSGSEEEAEPNLPIGKDKSGTPSVLLADIRRSKTSSDGKHTVKIAMPTAPEPDSDEEIEKQPLVVTAKTHNARQGVSSLFPAPKVKGQSARTETGLQNPNMPTVKQTSRILVPHTVTKQAATNKTAEMRAKLAKQHPKESPANSDDDDDDNIPMSFFSFESSHNVPVAIGSRKCDIGPILPPESVIGPALGPQLPTANDAQMMYNQYPDAEGAMTYGSSDYQFQQYSDSAHGTESEINSVSQIKSLQDDEAFRRLHCGKKRKRKGADDIGEIVDVNESDTIAEIQEYRKKMASQEDTNYTPPVKTNFIRIPSSDARRKHQITWLAIEAREREMKLQNQWAESKLTKRQTQAKYGW